MAQRTSLTAPTAEQKAAWVAWLATYGPDKFFDAFVATAQNAQSTCKHCGEPIYLDIVEGGGVPDWGSLDNHGLDYGCPKSPDTTADATGGHVPIKCP
jgi:hypothetical protein